jgi:DNA-binding SARP family transcriptional activator
MLTPTAWKGEGLMRFAILGPLEITDDNGRAVELASHKLRALLALLVVDANHVVALDTIIDQLWGDRPPATATGTLQAYISQLRRALEPDRRPREAPRVVVTQPPGYVLRAEPDQIDALCFRHLVAEGDGLVGAGDAARGEATLARALALWRGEPLADLVDEPFVQPEAVRLTQLRLLAWERRLEAWLALGRHVAAAAELEALVDAHPLRERLWALLMTALYRAGRQADAMRAFQRCRATLDEELGLEPGPELRRLEEAILLHEPLEELRAPSAVPPLVPPRPPAPEPADAEGTAVAPGAHPPLVGRAAPLGRLQARLHDACRGRGAMVLIEGEAGVGKTRLAEELTTAAAARGMACAWGRAAETAGAPPFWPWVQVVRALPAEGGWHGNSLAELLGDRLPAAAHDGDPSAARFRLSQAMVDVLADAAARQPLLVVLDDLQWADTSSCQFLQFLAAELARVPILVVATFRPVEEGGAGLEELLGALARHRACERFTLRGLSVADVEDYLRLTGVPGSSRSALARALHERTDGNPFFLIELLRLLTSERTIDHLGADDAVALDVPGSVRDVIVRRLNRLPEDTETLLRLAAVIGREFDLDLLERVSGVGTEHLVERIEPTLVTGLVTESDVAWSCRFSHALVQETLYRSLNGLQRARLHRRVGEALESLHGEAMEGHLDEAAHHFFAGRATGTAKAVQYARRAAEAATRDLAHDEAAAHWERALAALDPALPDGARQRYEILLGLGEARRRVGDLHGAREALEEAIGVARALADEVLVARAACVFGGVTLWNWRSYGEVDFEMVALLEHLVANVGRGESALRAQLLGTLAVDLYYSDRKREREAYAAEAVALARPTGDPVLLGRVLNNAFIAMWTPDREAERRAATEEALAWAGQGLPRDTEVIARMHRMWSLLRQGELEAYDAELAECRRLAAEVRVPEIAGQVMMADTGRAILEGRWAEAERLGEQAFEQLAATTVWGAYWCRAVQLHTIRREQGRLEELVPELLALCDEPGGEPIRPTAVLALAELGHHDEARRRLETWGAARPFDWSWDFLTAQWASVAALIGQPDPAALYDDLLPLADRVVVAGTGNTTWGSTHAVLGRLARRLGRPDLAEHHFEAAVAQNRRLRARPFEARARLELERLGEDALAGVNYRAGTGAAGPAPLL